MRRLVERLEIAPDPASEGVDVCAELIQDIARIPGVSSVNLLTLGNPEAVAAAIQASGLPQRN